MIQDIYPKHFNNQYKPYKPKAQDTVFFFKGSAILAKAAGTHDEEQPEKSELIYPTYEEFSNAAKQSHEEYTYTYLFAVDDDRFFLAMKNELQKGVFTGEMTDAKVHDEYADVIKNYKFYGVNSFRKAKPKEKAFAAITAFHLYGWYRDNRFCGRCGNVMKHDIKERMMRCECCKNMVFPKICPAVIVAVTNNDKLLLTKYAGRTYTNYALIAGFTEIGETVEETVQREVMEEVGLKVKSLCYYKSQPWALSGSILIGYFCEVDGNDTIRIDEDELSVGTWVAAGDIDLEDDNISLTREMILEFKKRICN